MKKLLERIFDGQKKIVQPVPNVEVHRIHREYAKELSKIKKRAKIIEQEAKDIRRQVDTTTRIAIASGALKNFIDYER